MVKYVTSILHMYKSGMAYLVTFKKMKTISPFRGMHMLLLPTILVKVLEQHKKNYIELDHSHVVHLLYMIKTIL